MDYPYCQRPFTVLAHRGGAGMAVNTGIENTLAAFSHALEVGCTHLETDVHATSDGVLVAFHDPMLDRVTDESGIIAAMPWHKVKHAKVGGEPIATLDEILDAFPESFVNIDIKHDGATQPLIDVLSRHRAWQRVCVGSFSSKRIRTFRRLARERTATAVGPVGVGWAVVGPHRMQMTEGDAYQVPHRLTRYGVPLVTPSFIEAAHRLGRAVHVWTVNEISEARELMDMGVDGIVTDRPDLMCEFARVHQPKEAPTLIPR
ncbi:glycerophosphodiester phosphodiesterase [Cutibacterium sp. WCA-380-WT-3A]|uniref:Glycerophosphodiester phosphodiesterase n=2 Tax=Cutibacterium porci TaxID=2605781 RepID=A0A7K0J679_9ACTN|nr:glycerophosphodiester phosphodiesterase [Cutibacterium porci]